MEMVDVYVPKIEGLDNIEQKRRVTAMETTLSKEPFDENVLSYINRLSDYLFVLARKLSKDLKADEIKWIPEKKG